MLERNQMSEKLYWGMPRADRKLNRLQMNPKLVSFTYLPLTGVITSEIPRVWTPDGALISVEEVEIHTPN